MDFCYFFVLTYLCVLIGVLCIAPLPASKGKFGRIFEFYKGGRGHFTLVLLFKGIYSRLIMI